jgi:hypothetical protein
VDLTTEAATAYAHGMWGRTGAITRIATNDGDLLAVAAQSTVALFDGRRFTEVAGGTDRSDEPHGAADDTTEDPSHGRA